MIVIMAGKTVKGTITINCEESECKGDVPDPKTARPFFGLGTGGLSP